MKIILENLKKFIIVIIILLLLILIGVSSSLRDNMSGPENIFGSAISYLEKAVYNIGHTISNAFYSIQNISKINEENQQLKESIYKLREENRILKNIVNDSEVLEAEYELKKNIKQDYAMGQIIAKDDSNWFNRFTIDIGENAGIKINDIVIQAVMTEDEEVVQKGLVGVVTEVGMNWAKVTALIDDNCKVSFKDIENKGYGIVSGGIDGEITGYYLNNKIEGKIGNKLYTSGIGEIYIRDIFIGTIKNIENTTDASTKKIYVEPVIDFSNLSDVFVIKVNR